MARPERLLEIAEEAIGAGGADDAEALVYRQAGGLTRFASSRIHQSAWREDLWVRVRVVVDGNRVGTATVHSADAGEVRATARRAAEVARAMPPDLGYPGMPGPATYPAAGRHDQATASADPATRAGLVAGVIGRLPAGVAAAGACETRELEIALANTRGVRAAGATTAASFSILADAGSGTGWAEGTEPALADLDVAALGERAARKAIDSRDPRELAPGSYPVVLEPNAASVLVQWLGWLGFGAKAYDEGRSFLVGRLGRRVCSPLVTIVDDATAADTIGVGFDFEGVPKRRVTLIDRGVAASLVYDFRAARRARGRADRPRPPGPLGRGRAAHAPGHAARPDPPGRPGRRAGAGPAGDPVPLHQPGQPDGHHHHRHDQGRHLLGGGRPGRRGGPQPPLHPVDP